MEVGSRADRWRTVEPPGGAGRRARRGAAVRGGSRLRPAAPAASGPPIGKQTHMITLSLAMALRQMLHKYLLDAPLFDASKTL